MADPRLMDQMTCHIPNKHVEYAISIAMQRGEYQQYAPPTGVDNLKMLVLKDFDLVGTNAEVCVMDGSLPAIYQAIKYICHPETYRRFVDSEPSWGWPRKYAAKDHKLVTRKITPDDIVDDRDFVNICSPQNPIGFDYTVEETIAIAEKAKKVNAWILQDCTYKDYSSHFYPIYKTHPARTITTWSMSTSPGMAGMRVGGVICHPKLMEDIYTLRPNQLGSNMPGQRAAASALSFKKEWLPDLLNIVDTNRQYIYSNLKIGECPQPDKSNSVWIEFPKEHDSTVVTAALKNKDLWVRDGIYYKGWGYEGNFIKVGIAVPHEWIQELVGAINNL